MLTPNHTIDRSQKLRSGIETSGLVCLDTEWKGWQAKLRFVCRNGHVSLIAPARFLSAGVRCKQCLAEAAIAQLHQIASDIGAVCLDDAWKGSAAQYRFRCKIGHEWERSGRASKARDVFSCPVCAGSKRAGGRQLVDGMKQLQVAATSRGGQLVSEAYAGVSARYRFRCLRDHEWEASGTDVLRGTWCLACLHEERRTAYRDADGLGRLQRAAAARGGACLSNIYEGGRKRYRFRCAKGHEWEASGKRIFRGAWCPECAHDHKRLSLSDAHMEAKTRGGACLSTTYTNCTVKLTWQCHLGHVWQTSLAVVRRGHWCPDCGFLAKITRPDSKARLRYIATGTTAAALDVD